MKSDKKTVTIDEYHSTFPKDIQGKLAVVQNTIRQLIPNGQEVISYSMLAFKVNKVVVFYAACKNHISLHPVPIVEEWQTDFEPYKTSGKGTIQFPYSKPLPIELIKRL